MAKKHLFFVCPSSHFPTSSSRPRLSKYKLVYRKRANEKQQNIFALKRHSFSKKKMNVKIGKGKENEKAAIKIEEKIIEEKKDGDAAICIYGMKGK